MMYFCSGDLMYFHSGVDKSAAGSREAGFCLGFGPRFRGLSMDRLLYSFSRRTISEWGTEIIVFMAFLKRTAASGPSIISTDFDFIGITVSPIFKNYA